MKCPTNRTKGISRSLALSATSKAMSQAAAAFMSFSSAATTVAGAVTLLGQALAAARVRRFGVSTHPRTPIKSRHGSSRNG